MEFWDKYKIQIIAIVVLIVIIVAVYFIAKSAGNKQGVSSVLASIPNPTVGDPLTNDESVSIRSLTTQIEGEMHWYTIHSIDLWATLASGTTDRILVGIYEQYKQDTGNDLVADIGNIISLDPIIVANKGVVLDRLNRVLNQ